MIQLHKLRIDRCRHCEADAGYASCQAEGRCAVDDDFASVVGRIRRAGAAVFVSSVYLGQPAAGLRALLHRLEQICRHEPTRERLSGIPTLAVCLGGGASYCAARLKRSLRACHLDVVGVVTAGRGEVDLKLKSFRIAGEKLAAACSAGRYRPVRRLWARRRRRPWAGRVAKPPRHASS